MMCLKSILLCWKSYYTTISSSAIIVKSISMNESLRKEFRWVHIYNGNFSLGNNQDYKKLCRVSRWVKVVKLYLAKKV